MVKLRNGGCGSSDMYSRSDSVGTSNERGCKAQPDGEVYCVLREWRRLE